MIFLRHFNTFHERVQRRVPEALDQLTASGFVAKALLELCWKVDESMFQGFQGRYHVWGDILNGIKWWFNGI